MKSKAIMKLKEIPYKGKNVHAQCKQRVIVCLTTKGQWLPSMVTTTPDEPQKKNVNTQHKGIRDQYGCEDCRGKNKGKSTHRFGAQI